MKDAIEDAATELKYYNKLKQLIVNCSFLQENFD